jgi:membrane protein
MEGPDRLTAIRSRVAALADLPPVAGVRTALDTFDQAGGGLVASGLAFTALFAIVPAFLLAFGVVGLVVSDDARRLAAIDELASYVPPLRDLLEESLADMARSAVQTSLLGLVGLVWGASRFVVALDDAFSRIFQDSPKRGFVGRTARAIMAVGLLLATVLGILALSAVASFLAESLRAELAGTAVLWQFLSPATAIVAASFAVALLYRAIPTKSLSWRTIALPGVVVGIVIALLTQLFAYVAPRLIGAAEILGGVAAVFTALAWLQLVFQALLLGAAWARVRSDAA